MSGALADVWVDAAAIFRREALRYARDRAYWAGQIAFPLAFVAFLGLGLNEVVTLPSGAGYEAHLASGVLVLLVGSGGVGAGFTLIEDRESGFLRALAIAPVTRTGIVLGKLAARGIASLLLVALLVPVFAAFTSLRLPHPGALLLSVAAVTSVFVALGIALASRLRRLESFRLLAAFATIPLYLFSGIFYPVETLPLAMRLLVYVNPLTYGVDLFRYALLDVHEMPLALDVVLLVGLGAVATALAVRVFARGAWA